MSGYKISTGQDLDAIFQRRTVVDPSAQYIGYITSNGTSLSDRYLPYTSGNAKSVTTRFNVTDASGNVQDVNNYYSRIPIWAAMGTPTNGTSAGVTCIFALDASNVYVGGNFSSAGGVSANYIARWNAVDSSWSRLGTGIPFSSVATVTVIYALNALNVYVGGIFSFTAAGGVLANNIAKWDGTNWNALGSGIGGSGTPHVAAIYALDASSVYVGGAFSNAGGVPCSNIAKWNAIDPSWSKLGSGTGGRVAAISALNASNVYVGGGFTDVGDIDLVNRIARWNAVDSSWSKLGTLTNGTSGTVLAISALDASNIYVGGAFTSAGGVSASRIARWSAVDSSWSSLGTGMGTTTPQVNSISAFNTGNVYAGGQFTTAGGVTCNNIAKWSANDASWSRLGNIGANNIVTAVDAVGSSTVYVGGVIGFSSAGGVSVNRIAKWS